MTVPGEWQVDPALPAPLHRQLAMNIKWSISTGAVESGEILPSVRSLAKQMGLSVNTVRLAYKGLTQERLIIARPKRGTVVLGVPEAPRKPSGPDNATEQLMAAAIDRALAAGYHEQNTREMFSELLSQAVAKRSRPRILFVECTEHDVLMLGTQLSQALSAVVTPMVLDSLEDWLSREQERLSEYRAVVTTFFHYQDVMQAMKGRGPQVFGVVVENGPSTRERLAQMLPGAHIGVVCRAQDSMQYFLNALHTMTGGTAVVRRAFIHEQDSMRSMLDWAQIVFITQPCKSAVEEMAPDKPVFFFYDSINEQSLAMLRDYLVQAPAPQA